jgi:hypothetical protein
VFLVAFGLAMVAGVIARPWLGWLCLVVAAFNALAVWIGVTFSSYHGKGWLVVGWGAYVGFRAVMLIAGVFLVRQPVGTAARAPSAAVS